MLTSEYLEVRSRLLARLEAGEVIDLGAFALELASEDGDMADLWQKAGALQSLVDQMAGEGLVTIEGRKIQKADGTERTATDTNAR